MTYTVVNGAERFEGPEIKGPFFRPITLPFGPGPELLRLANLQQRGMGNVEHAYTGPPAMTPGPFFTHSDLSRRLSIHRDSRLVITHIPNAWLEVSEFLLRGGDASQKTSRDDGPHWNISMTERWKPVAELLSHRQVKKLIFSFF